MKSKSFCLTSIERPYQVVSAQFSSVTFSQPSAFNFLSQPSSATKSAGKMKPKTKAAIPNENSDLIGTPPLRYSGIFFNWRRAENTTTSLNHTIRSNLHRSQIRRIGAQARLFETGCFGTYTGDRDILYQSLRNERGECLEGRGPYVLLRPVLKHSSLSPLLPPFSPSRAL